MKVSIIGTGYVGLVTGACLAEQGHTVICVDIDAARVAQINRGEVPFHEPGLGALLKRNVGRRLSASTDLPRAIRQTALTLVSVGTPFDGRAIDLRFVKAAATSIGQALRDKPGYHVVVVKSTVVPGTTDEVVTPLLEEASGKRAGRDFGVGMNPEFLSEGEALRDFMSPDRLVLGGGDARTLRALGRLYQRFEDVPVMRTTNRTAEMIKYASNALLATLISFSNEMANVCSDVGGMDVADVMEGVHLSQYLSPKISKTRRVRAPITAFLKAGCGFGGSCLPKDVRALIARGLAAGGELPLLASVMRINEQRTARMLALVRRHHPDLRGLPVAVLGLAFKPGTDDLRESPAIPLIHALQEAGAEVYGYDPVAGRTLEMPGLRRCATLEGALRSCRVALVVTAWEEFRELPKLVRRIKPAPLIVDGRRMLPKDEFERYEGIGLG